MLVRFPPRVIGPSEEERAFLTELNGRANRIQDMGRDRFGRLPSIITYHPIELLDGEIERVLALIGMERRLALRPVGYGPYPEVAFEVGHVGPRPDLRKAEAPYERLCLFANKQLPGCRDPKEVNGRKCLEWFDKLADTFMQPSNVALVTSCGLEAPERSYGKYDY